MNYHIKDMLTLLLICTTAIAFLPGCEKQLPNDLQEEKGFELSAMDETACTLLSQDSSEVESEVNAVKIDMSTWLSMPDSLIATVLDTLHIEEAMLVRNNTESDSAYAVLFQNTEQNVYFYFSWDLSEANVDAYIETSIIGENSAQLKLLSRDMTLESIAGCTSTFESAGQEVVAPKIRARYLYKLKPGAYLIRFYISEPATIGNFRMVILHN